MEENKRPLTKSCELFSQKGSIKDIWKGYYIHLYDSFN